jgi:serine/threonine-protein kinase
MRGELSPGEHLGKYQVLRKLATGDMAEIYLARSTGTAGFEKLVVIKRILPTAAQDTQLVSMFLDEAKLAATLRHPNIASVIDVDSDDDSYFFAMEHVFGQDMRRIRVEAEARGRPIPLTASIAIIIGAAQALAYAHDVRGSSGPLGVVHRDVSPSNILVSYEGAVKLVDFGIARATGRTTKTLTGTLKGKLAYMSPEQCRGKKLDGRSDLFSLGIVLYELTCSVRPFEGTSDLETLEKIVQGDFVPPSRVVPGYPPALESIVKRLLATEPGSRYPNAHALLPELEAQVAALGTFNPALALAKYMGELFAEELETAEMEDDVRTSPTGRKRAGTAVTVTVGRVRTEQDSTTAMRETLAALDAGTARDPTATVRVPVDPIAIELLADLDASAPESESPHERTRRRIEALLECAFACHGVGDLPRAMVAIELAMAEDPGSDLTRELFARNRSTVTAVFEAFLADKSATIDEFTQQETRPELSRYRQLWLILQ